MSYRVVHYINQFFANIGGEEMAHVAPELREGFVGPGMAFNQAWKGEAEIVKTIICGDSYYAEHEKEAKAQILEWVKAEKPDIFIAGPAFNAGRYGYACANVALAVKEELGIPVLTGMYVENPGADLKNKVLIYETANSAAGMRKAAPGMAKLALKLMKGEEIGASCQEGYMPNGIRKNFFEKERGSKRAVDMLLKKLNGEHFVTEYPMPSFDRVAPNPAIKDLSKATIALCTSGGIVPKGNPDHIESSSASHYGEYSLDGFDKLSSADHETAHGGYDPVYANEDPNRVLPVDVMREFEREGKIGKLHNLYYATVGNGTAVASAKAFAAEYAQKLKKAGVDAVIMTSTGGTCTRCGATMVKEIERAGIPVVHMCTVTPISMTVGANRIVPTIAIPHPLGNPSLSHDEEYALRKKLVNRALEALTTEVTEQTIFEV